MSPRSATANIKRIYAFSFFWMFLVLIPIIVPYFLSLGLSMKEILQLQAFYAACVVLLEIPTGYVSDMLNRRASLILGSLISALCFTFLPFAENLSQLFVYEGLLALGYTLVSGTDLAIYYDSLPANSARETSTKGISVMQSNQVYAESIASVLGGLMAAYSFAHVLWLHALVAWVPFFIALSIVEPAREKMRGHTHWNNFKSVLQFLFRGDALLRMIFLNMVVWGLSTFFAVWTYQKYWQEIEIPLAHFGWLWAGYNLSVGLVSRQVHAWEKRFGPIILLWFLGLAPIAGYLMMGTFGSWLGVLGGLLICASRGITQVLLKDAFNWRLPSQFRATANSIQSLGFRLGFALVAPFIGWLIDTKGLDWTFFTLALIFGICMLLFMWPLIKMVRRIHPTPIPPNKTPLVE